MDSLDTLTPVEYIDGVFVKRDDYFKIAGVCGGKARTCFALARGGCGLVTAGSRQSPQVNIVAHIAKYLGIGSRLHVPCGKLTPELEDAKLVGANIIQHSPGYNSVIISRAKKDALDMGWINIPFGMECKEAVLQTAKQVKNIPKGVKRIIVPVGSGMSLAGILHGLRREDRNIPVLGIKIGADPIRRLDMYAPIFWGVMVQLVDCGYDYHKSIKGVLGDIILDPIYEAKCLQFLKYGDLFWIVGIRKTVGAV